MALEEYVGAIVMEVDYREIEVTDLKEDVTTGRKLVKTMNKTGRAKGFSRGIEEIQLTVTVVIPESGDLNWGGIEGAKITQYPLNSSGKRVSYGLLQHSGRGSVYRRQRSEARYHHECASSGGGINGKAAAFIWR